ncbi:MAG TPA: serine/threonine-protein kinase [Kofleriaceae bacterium]|nr:serine/threonine-protein kinase [Kofleriaceae bacterium]
MELTDRQLGRYHLLRLLGFGGMGEVYLANSKGVAGFEKLVTVKILRRQVSQNPDRVRDLLREAFIGVRLDHENIVQVLDLGEHEGNYFLVMEYVRGFSLRELISFHAEQHELVPIRPIVHALRCVADALDYVHKVRGPHKKHIGLIHRDVSPSNILLGAEGRIKLSDFGVSGMAQDAATAGTVIGKPRYLPPEARHGEPATQGWDVYALGVVLHSVLAADPDIERGGAKIGARLMPLGDIRPDVPAPIVDLVARATARDPADRLADAATFRKLLDEAVPRQADDAEHWRGWLQGLYRREAFVTRYGVLPYVEDLVPDLEAREAQPTSVAYVETVVVDTQKPIRFGLSPALGVDAARSQGERVATWLKKRFDRDVRPVVVGDYQALVDAIAEGEVDFAWMPPVSFVRAADRGVGVVALAQRYGRPTYESAIIVRADSPLVELADLRGKSIAFGDRESASGYLFAADLIGRELGPLDQVLGEQHFQGSHKAVTDSVRRKWVDAGVTYAVRDAEGRIVNSGWLDLGAPSDVPLRVLAMTEPIPCDAIAHRPGLAQGLVDRLGKVLVEIDDDAEGRVILTEVFHTTGMMRADLRIYDAVREAMQRVARR